MPDLGGVADVLSSFFPGEELMFEMYDKANTENREAIKACTEAINKLCDKLDDVRG